MLKVKPQPARTAARQGKARQKPAAAVPAEGVTIAEAARRTGVSVHALRYYERAGLVVSPIDRTSGGRRRYRHLDLKWIIICTKLRATGMPIRGIRRYAELVAAGPGNEQERLELLEGHRADVVARLTEIQENLKEIDRKIGIYRGSLAAGEADQLWAPARPDQGADCADPEGAVPGSTRTRAPIRGVHNFPNANNPSAGYLQTHRPGCHDRT